MHIPERNDTHEPGISQVEDTQITSSIHLWWDSVIDGLKSPQRVLFVVRYMYMPVVLTPGTLKDLVLLATLQQVVEHRVLTCYAGIDGGSAESLNCKVSHYSIMQNT